MLSDKFSREPGITITIIMGTMTSSPSSAQLSPSSSFADIFTTNVTSAYVCILNESQQCLSEGKFLVA